jgi:hypothetical protein
MANHFVLMQREMCDQFIQTLLNLGRTLSDQQNEQFGIIWAELAELRQMTREIQTLQVESAKHSPRTGRPSLPRSGEARTPNRRGQGEARPHRKDKVDSSAATPTAAGPQNGESPSSNGDHADEDLHAEISLRLEALQQERQGRWRSLLQLLTGNRADE